MGPCPAEPRPAPRALCRPYQGNPTFDPEFIRSKSTAAAGLCSWCINIVRFYEVYCDVAPKRQALEEANAELAEAQDKLTRIKNKIAVRAAHAACRPRECRPRRPGRAWRSVMSVRRGRLGLCGEQRTGVAGGPCPPGPLSIWACGQPCPVHVRTLPLVFPGTQRQPEQPDLRLRKSDRRENQVPAGG